MIIDHVNYPVSLTDIDNIRYLFFTNLYGENTTYIQNLAEIIARNIDCLGIDYSKSDYSFTIKIKKTSMKKISGFIHEPNFYYQIISKIFNEFIHENESVIISILSQKYDNSREVLQYLYTNTYILANLCHVSCITDNVLLIRL